MEPKDSESKAIQKEKNDRLLDWPDDGKLRAVLFIGNRITGKKEYTNEKSTVTLEYDGDALDIISDFSVSCGDVEGDVTTASGTVTISGDVDGDITTASGTVMVSGDVDGDIITANGPVNCGDVDGDITTQNGNIDCGDISGVITVNDTSGTATVQCGDIEGDVSISGGGTVTVSGDVDGDITAGTVIRE